MAAVLRIGRERVSEKGTASARKHVAPLAGLTTAPRDAVVRRLGEHFRRTYGGEADEPTAEELAAAGRLAAEKYDAPGWTAEFP